MIGDDADQLDLFADRPAPAPKGDSFDDLAAVAAHLPAGVRFGTSSWNFPGWAGIVYRQRYKTKTAFTAQALAEYGKHPLLRTVCVDRAYYAPVPVEDFQTYAAQTPPDFRFVSKTWSEITTRVFANHSRLGDRAGQPNPHFLSVEYFREYVLAPAKAGLGEKLGPIVLEFPPERGARDGVGFARELDRFLTALATDVPLAVEIREPVWMSRAYFDVLRAHRVGHVFNFWSRMPSLREQYKAAAGFSAPQVVLRLMLPAGRKYDELKEAWAPFDRIVEPQPRMRAEAVDLLIEGVKDGREALVIVNNKAEGSAPLTIAQLAKALAGAKKKG